MAETSLYIITENDVSNAKTAAMFSNSGFKDINKPILGNIKTNFYIYGLVVVKVTSLTVYENLIDHNLDTLCKISYGTAVKVYNTCCKGNDVWAKIKCGNKYGFIFLGKLNSNGTGWDGRTNVYFATYKNDDTTKNALGLTGNGIRLSPKSYPNLNNGNTLDTSRIEPGSVPLSSNNTSSSSSSSTSTSEEENTDAATESSINNMNTAAQNAGMTTSGGDGNGDIDVTYEFAIDVTPTFYYNIEDHLGGTNVDEDVMKHTDIGINYAKLRNIFGMPYQFLPTTDCRVSSGFSDDIEKAGYEIAEKIVSRIPLLYITPGNTSFMGGSSENARTALIGSLKNKGIDAGGDELTESSLETMLGDYNGKLYTITPAYVEYFNYVNPLCRAGAIFLDIAGTSFDSDHIIGNKAVESDNGAFANTNWAISEGLAYVAYEEEDTTLEEEDAEEDESEETSDEEATEPTRAKFEQDYTDFFVKYEDKTGKSDSGKLKDFESSLYYSNAIAFYINSDSSFQDSFSNETSESILSTTINSLSDRAREVQFLLGTASNAVGEAFDKVDGTLSAVKQQINDIVESIAGGNSIFTTIANSVKTIVSGGRLLFPQIWANSNFSKQYSISIKLTTPSTDRVSWWLNIYVPLCHLMALVLPRSEYVNSYTTPFLIKAFYKGMFNIDMGIITEMTFNKGKEGSWTKDALPTVVDVSFSIQDLYSAMGITSIDKMFKGLTLQNVSEMDYVANLCGININEPDTLRMVNLWCAFNMTNRVYDFLPRLSLGIESYISTGIINSYNNFWY